jgi:hypothetical protein
VGVDEQDDFKRSHSDDPGDGPSPNPPKRRAL